MIQIVNESNLKPNKLSVDQGRKFYNKWKNGFTIQEWLYKHNILMYSTHNEGKSVFAESILKTLDTKISKQMVSNDSKIYLRYLN